MWEDDHQSREDRLGEDRVGEDREREDRVAEDWRVEDRTLGEWSSLQKNAERKVPFFSLGQFLIKFTSIYFVTKVSTIIKL